MNAKPIKHLLCSTDPTRSLIQVSPFTPYHDFCGLNEEPGSVAASGC